jgi:hypothetical protein
MGEEKRGQRLAAAAGRPMGEEFGTKGVGILEIDLFVKHLKTCQIRM